MTNGRKARLVERFKDRDYRHDYTESFFDTLIATQIRALRSREGWTQAKLGKEAGTTQSGISEFENSDYSRWSVATLRRLARIFDVALEVRFVDFGRALRTIQNFGSSDVQVPSFSHDSAFQRTPAFTASETVSGVSNSVFRRVSGSRSTIISGGDTRTSAPVLRTGPESRTQATLERFSA